MPFVHTRLKQLPRLAVQGHDEDRRQHEDGGGDVVQAEPDPARRRDEGEPPAAVGVHLSQELVAEPGLRSVRPDRRQALRTSRFLRS